MKKILLYLAVTAGISMAFAPLDSHGAEAYVATPGSPSTTLYKGTSTKKGTAQDLAACFKAGEALKAAGAYRCTTVVPFTVKKVTTPDPVDPAPTTWVECARETGTCAFTGTKQVKYGGKQPGQQAIIKTLPGPVKCEDATFGAAHSNYENFCFIGGVGVDTPTEPVTPAPPASIGSVGPRVSTFTPSGAIRATSGQVIAGVSISNPGGNCVTIPVGADGVVVRDSQIGPCGGDANIVVQGNNATVEHNNVFSGKRGILVNRAGGAVLRKNTVPGPFAGNSCGNPSNPDHCSGAVQLDNANNATIDGNKITGDNYGSDALSGYESSGLRFINNEIDVGIKWQHAAPFTMGDSTTGNPGKDNYVAGNIVRQRGGVPPGVFGAGGNTVFEFNCLTTGIQAYNYSGIFEGVTIRFNAIGPGSYVPKPELIAQWGTNVSSADCSKIPK